jgi:hypothetical protein
MPTAPFRSSPDARLACAGVWLAVSGILHATLP